MNSTSLHLLLPFALPELADADVALHKLEAPALEKLLARATLRERRFDEAFQRTLPHERWLARQFNAAATAALPPAAVDAAPLAPYMMLADGCTPSDIGVAQWACIQPVHVRIARDHLVLVDPESLALSAADAAPLLAAARASIESLGLRLAAPTPLRWYVSGAALGQLAGASPLRAAGRSIEIWLPHEAGSGARSRAWMKLQNEVQMAWFEHPVNQAREQRGLPAANSIWLHAQGALQPVARPFARVLSAAPATRGLALAGQAGAAPPPAGFAALPAEDGATLVELDTLVTAFMLQDWAAWQEAYAALERQWFAPALQALHDGALRQFALTLCADTGYVTLALGRADLRKFWRRRPLRALLGA